MLLLHSMKLLEEKGRVREKRQKEKGTKDNITYTETAFDRKRGSDTTTRIDNDTQVCVHFSLSANMVLTKRRTGRKKSKTLNSAVVVVVWETISLSREERRGQRIKWNETSFSWEEAVASDLKFDRSREEKHLDSFAKYS